MSEIRSSSDPRHDLRLVQRVLRGERRSLSELSSRLECVPRILHTRNRRKGRALDGQELLDLEQDILAILWRKLDGYAGLSALEGWVYRICVLEFMNALRRKRKKKDHEEPLEEESSGSAAAPTVRDPFEYEDVHVALRRIGKKEEAVILLKHFEGLTFEEIGEKLGVSTNTIKARYYRGLDELRPLLVERMPGS